MSLIMMALRICAVEAIKEADTMVGHNVLDSQISALDHTSDRRLTSDQPAPFVAVYSDYAKNVDLVNVGLRGNGEVELLFNSGVSMAMTVTNKETGESVIHGLPATDANLEALLDILDAQICRALIDEENSWAQVFGGLIDKYVKKEVLRTSSSADQVRIAAGQLKLTVKARPDPGPGQGFVETGPFGQFMTLMEASGLPQFAWFQLLLSGGDGSLYPSFEHLTSMTHSDAQSLQLYDFQDVGRTVRVSGAAVVEGPEVG